MREQHFLVDFDLEPLSTKLYNPKWPCFAEEHKLDMDVKIERLRLKILLSQPAPLPQDILSPQRSPAVDTGSEESALPRAETQLTKKEIYIFSSCRGLNGCLHVCKSPE